MLRLVRDIFPVLILYSWWNFRLLYPVLYGWIYIMTVKSYWCHLFHESYVYCAVHHCVSRRIKDQLDVTCYFISLLMCSTFSDINISIIRSLRLFCWIITLVVLFLVRCVLEFRCSWVGVVSVLQAEACNTDTTPTQLHRNSNTHRTKNNTTNVIIQQNSRKLLMMDILISENAEHIRSEIK